jgi:hypothetical protein
MRPGGFLFGPDAACGSGTLGGSVTESGASKSSSPAIRPSLSTALSSIAGYQRTICATREADYLVRRIRGEDEPLRLKADQLLGEISATAADLVRRLDWRDFETLVDLIFAHSGYKRRTALSGAKADIDFVAQQPLTGESAWVQVRSQASQAIFERYLERYRWGASASAFFFVYHSASRSLRTKADMPGVHIWPADKVANAAVEAGLFRWIAERVR